MAFGTQILVTPIGVALMCLDGIIWIIYFHEYFASVWMLKERREKKGKDRKFWVSGRIQTEVSLLVSFVESSACFSD